MKALLFALLLLAASGATLGHSAHPFTAAAASEVPTPAIVHADWDALLRAHVSADGQVDYKAIVAAPKQLDDYLKLLKKVLPEVLAEWSEDDRKAFWINVYNAATVRVIATYYPIPSMQDIRIRSFLGSPRSPWEKSLVNVGGETYSLNQIEHQILRKRYTDPRIHFGLVCAAISCPILRNEAYVGARLSKQLDEQAAKFINDPTKNYLVGDEVMLSNVFDWYAQDFGQDQQAVLDYLNRYAAMPVRRGVHISYLPYNWGLNEQGPRPRPTSPVAGKPFN